jgi:hypothetical protein
MPASSQSKKASFRGGFFSVDLGAFRCAAIGGLNSAVAHLVMARGTGPDNLRTQWSINAIEKRTGISRPNAANAVKDLIARGVWKKTRDGQHPVYEAIPGHQIPGGPFTATEQAALAAIRNEDEMPYESKSAVDALIARSLITKTVTRESLRRRTYQVECFEIDEAAIAALTAPLAVWLPNTLVDGAAGEVAPVELIRQAHDHAALRQLVELYAAQFLPDYAGVPRDLLSVSFDRKEIGEQGPFVVWGFRPKNMYAGHGLYGPFLTGKAAGPGDVEDVGMNASFWPGIKTLENLGLLERVGMLLDGDGGDAEIIHPYAIRGGEPAERELASAAHSAAEAMLTEGQINWAEQNGFFLIPILRHIAKVSMIEVIRLKYRPHTSATAAWYAQMLDGTAQYLDRYKVLSKKSPAAQISVA